LFKSSRVESSSDGRDTTKAIIQIHPIPNKTKYLLIFYMLFIASLRRIRQTNTHVGNHMHAHTYSHAYTNATLHTARRPSIIVIITIHDSLFTTSFVFPSNNVHIILHLKPIILLPRSRSLKRSHRKLQQIHPKITPEEDNHTEIENKNNSNETTNVSEQNQLGGVIITKHDDRRL
jgi:hypothetical protein